jgi:hypothetical protein
MENEEIQNNDPTKEKVDKRNVRVFHKPIQVGSRYIHSDGSQYMRRKDGSLIRITEKKLSKKERRRRKKLENKN